MYVPHIAPGVLMTLTVVALISGVFAISLIVFLIYKSTPSMHKDDRLFLDDVSSHMHAQACVQQRVRDISGGARADVDLPKG
jgi:hypothetical protein